MEFLFYDVRTIKPGQMRLVIPCFICRLHGNVPEFYMDLLVKPFRRHPGRRKVGMASDDFGDSEFSWPYLPVGNIGKLSSENPDSLVPIVGQLDGSGGDYINKLTD